MEKRSAYIPKEGKVMEEKSILKTLAAKVDRGTVRLIVVTVFVLILVVVVKYGNIDFQVGLSIKANNPVEMFENREKPEAGK